MPPPQVLSPSLLAGRGEEAASSLSQCTGVRSPYFSDEFTLMLLPRNNERERGRERLRASCINDLSINLFWIIDSLSYFKLWVWDLYLYGIDGKS